MTENIQENLCLFSNSFSKPNVYSTTIATQGIKTTRQGVQRNLSSTTQVHKPQLQHNHSRRQQRQLQLPSSNNRPWRNLIQTSQC